MWKLKYKLRSKGQAIINIGRNGCALLEHPFSLTFGKTTCIIFFIGDAVRWRLLQESHTGVSLATTHKFVMWTMCSSYRDGATRHTALETIAPLGTETFPDRLFSGIVMWNDYVWNRGFTRISHERPGDLTRCLWRKEAPRIHSTKQSIRIILFTKHMCQGLIFTM